MNKEQEKLYEGFVETLSEKNIELSLEEMFHAGCLALRQEIENFINDKLKGERGDAFSQGQDDGLRWVRDHLSFIFDKGF